MARERVAGCLRWPYEDTVKVLHSPANRKGAFGGLQTCGSVWMCPVCSAKISERRRVELGQAVREWEGRGGRVVLVTYTLRHKEGDSLERLVDGLQLARKRMISGKAAITYRARFDVAGSVRAIEVTHGVNGWHPHMHELLFVSSQTDLEALEGYLRGRWAAVTKSAGMRDVSDDHGVKVQASYGDVADYVAKFGRDPVSTWGVEHELSKAVVKKGRSGSRTPMDFLEASLLGDTAAGRLFQEYAVVFKGRRQLAYSTKLRELLNLGEDRTDEEIAADTTDLLLILAEITRPQWKVVLGLDLRSDVVELAGRGDRGKLLEFLCGHGVFQGGER